MGEITGYNQQDLKRLKRLVRKGRRYLAELEERTTEEELTLHLSNRVLEDISIAQEKFNLPATCIVSSSKGFFENDNT